MASVKEPLSRSRHDDVDLDRDRALVERCQAGDQRAFEDLYLRYRERLHRSCLRRTGDAGEAEDIVQEAFARAWKALPRFDGERRFYPWLSVIAGNLCTDLARRGGRCTPVEEADLDLMAPVEASEQERFIDASGDGQMLAAALGRLSPRHREVLELREGRNWSYQQIAAHAGVEVSTIETLLFRARRSLKREFLTIARAETGLAGILAFPFVALRKLFRRARKGIAHSPAGAKVAALASATPGATIAGGAAALITAAVLAAGALAGAHLSNTAAASRVPFTASGGQLASGGQAARDTGSASYRATHRRASADTARSSGGHDQAPASSAGSTGGLTGTTGGIGASLLGSGFGALGGGLAGVGATVNSTLSSALGSTAKTVTGTVKKTVEKVAAAVNSATSGTSSTVSSVSGTVSSITGGLP